MKKAYKVEIKPTEQQEQKIKQTIGVCRYVYNLYLSKNKEVYEKEKKFMSGYDFSKWLNNVHTKQTDQWIKDVSSKAVKQSAMNAEKAFKNFFKGLTKFPRFKKKKNQDVKAYFPKNNKTDWTIERHRVKIPTIGWMKLKEHGYIPTHAIVKSGTVSHKAGRYYVSVLCEVDAQNNQININDGIGVDLGIKDFAVCSHHKVFENINKTLQVKKLEKKLKREQRSLSRKYEHFKKKGGVSAAKKRANIDKNLLRLQKIHARLTNIREEYVRTVVNSLVKAKPKYITIEDLNVKRMMKNRHLSDSVRKQKFFRFKQWLTSKCNEHGIELRAVDRFYPSSKTCSCCGSKKVDLSLSDRMFKCDDCDMELDRDFNASLNLKYAAEYTVITKR
ncbi:RNA-guided endonuclease InsQ/TnpB family protein [Bacillus taeanensis]|uniref:Transposase n=1 Tax=Bacillus taeanensis TaxID=273032 RepID=A0A366XU07_9BACI|nr:RNA-guided endonuclease TnpB family protein [Bacillus taeanensis]RBW69038.1 transposase [Bacillus taeanensis]